jgi:hypothetical protein
LHGFGETDVYNVEWMDMKGAIVHQEKMSISTADVMLSIPQSLSNSFYLLRVSSAKTIYHFRIEVVR